VDTSLAGELLSMQALSIVLQIKSPMLFVVPVVNVSFLAT